MRISGIGICRCFRGRKHITAQQVWQAALGELQLQMTKATFDTWMKGTSVVSYEDSVFTIGVPTVYAQEWLEHRLLPMIRRTLARITGETVEVRFGLQKNKASQLKGPEPLLQTIPDALTAPAKTPPLMVLNSRYTFGTFIVGNGNRLAHAASLAVAENPAAAYNPLFLYGGVGLGKTHLLHAIAHLSLRRHPGLRVLYVSSEEFTNDLIDAIRRNTPDKFRRKYRRMDVLLIDDIQFIAGKESTQEAFFHTFNTLHAANKQIVISSDRPPRAIVTLEERLRSRFEGGLIADIQPPDLETRIAILRSKGEAQPVPIPDEVVDFIAQHVTDNIRDLEGALNRVVAYSHIMHLPLTGKLATKALRHIVIRHVPLSPPEILEVVARFYGLEVADLEGDRRTKAIALPRHVAMYLLREETGLSLPKIGQKLGGRDHTTVLYGYEKISRHIEENDQLRRELLTIKETLYGQNRPST